MANSPEDRSAKKKLKINSLMPYIDDLSDVNGLRLSGYLDSSVLWPDICSHSGDPSDRVQELLQTWLSQGSEDAPCTWPFLVDTLRKVGKGDVADRIEEDICPPSNCVVSAQCSDDDGQPSALHLGRDPLSSLPPHSPPTAQEALQTEMPVAGDVFKLIGIEVSSQWKQFGTLLGVQSTVIAKIRRDNPFSVDDCFLSLIEKWLQKDNNTGTFKRNWEAILSVTKDIGYAFLSDEVQVKLISGQRR